jgi:Tol biopolymer transport system component
VNLRVALAVVTAMLLVGTVLGVWAWRTAGRPQPRAVSGGAVVQRTLTRLTFGSGLQTDVTWSPDGRFIAYASDRSGNFDIWVQSTKGGDAIRITNSEQHEWQPDWSPDGNSIAFRSEREGGGLFVVPAPFGGQQQKLSSFGYNPRWSPDGSKVLFFGLGTRLYERPKVFVVRLDGSTPTEVSAFMEGYEQGVKRGALDWHPDGRRVSFLADDKSLQTVPIEGGEGVRSAVDDSVARRLEEAAVEIENFRWSSTGKLLFIEGRSQGVLNIWRITVDPETLRWVAGPERLTVGDGQDTDISISRDGTKIAYTKKNQSTGIWLFPFDAARGQVKGPGQPVTPRDSDAWFPDISADGRKIIFSVFRQGMVKQEIWEKSLGGPKDKSQSEQRRLAEISGAAPFCLRWSPDSTRIAFSRLNRVEPGGTWKAASMFLLNTADGAEQPLTTPPSSEADEWRDYVYDWSPDGQWVIGSTDRPTPKRWLLAMFPVEGAPSAEKGLRVLLKDPDADLWAPRISPDGRWVVYLRQEDTMEGGPVSAIYVIPAGGGAPVRVTDARYWSDKPRWSPDGKNIFFVSNRDSYFLNVWGVRFDPAAGTVSGEPFRVTNIGNPSLMISNRLAYMEIALSQELLILPLPALTGSVWVMENVQS